MMAFFVVTYDLLSLAFLKQQIKMPKPLLIYLRFRYAISWLSKEVKK
jgi:hypothetical protein